MPRVLRENLEIVAVIAAVTVGGWFSPLNFHALGQVYLLAVIALSLRVTRWSALIAAVTSGVIWNFVFVPPRLSFSVLHTEDGLQLGTYLVVALVGGQLTSLRAASERAGLLAESDRLHRTLLDSVSHELKTPLAVLRTASEQLGTEDRSKQQSLALEICTAVHRLDSLVTNLLNQTRLEAGAIKPRMDWCDPRDLVVAARRAVGERLDGRPLDIDMPPNRPMFFADAAMMEQVIANLLLNAAMHTPRGTAIHIGTGAIEKPPRVFISVKDEGPGIPPELREEIFSKFHGGLATRPGGLGLGLSIVRGFMQAQGGDVSLMAPRKGALFTVYLPRVSEGNVPSG